MSYVISKRYLERVIKEELDKILREEPYVRTLVPEGFNPYRDPETGHFAGPKAGNVYSLSKDGARRAGVSSRYVKRGTVTSPVASDAARTQVKPTGDSDSEPAGRQKHDSGKPVTPKRMVSQYPELYKEEEEGGMLPTEPIAELQMNELIALVSRLLDRFGKGRPSDAL